MIVIVFAVSFCFCTTNHQAEYCPAHDAADDVRSIRFQAIGGTLDVLVFQRMNALAGESRLGSAASGSQCSGQ